MFGSIFCYILIEASSNSSRDSFGLFAKTALFILDASRAQLEIPIIGTFFLSSSNLCKTFKQFVSEASANPNSSKTIAILNF